MTKGMLLGPSTKTAVCPKCSEKGSIDGAISLSAKVGEKIQITRTFLRDNKGYWKCSACNYKLSRDERMIRVRVAPPAMVMKAEEHPTVWNVPKLEVPEGHVVV